MLETTQFYCELMMEVAHVFFWANRGPRTLCDWRRTGPLNRSACRVCKHTQSEVNKDDVQVLAAGRQKVKHFPCQRLADHCK